MSVTIKADVVTMVRGARGEAPVMRVIWNQTAEKLSVRRMNAELLFIAAMLELVSEGEDWIVRGSDGPVHAGSGRMTATIRVELYAGDADEVRRLEQALMVVAARCGTGAPLLG